MRNRKGKRKRERERERGREREREREKEKQKEKEKKEEEEKQKEGRERVSLVSLACLAMLAQEPALGRAIAHAEASDAGRMDLGEKAQERCSALWSSAVTLRTLGSGSHPLCWHGNLHRVVENYGSSRIYNLYAVSFNYTSHHVSHQRCFGAFGSFGAQASAQ